MMGPNAQRHRRPTHRGSSELRRRMLLLGLLAVWASPSPGSAHADTAAGPHQAITLTFSTSTPGSPAGVKFSGTYRNPSDPSANPPALRRVVATFPSGSVIDTSATARCRASDQQLQMNGDAACPPASKLGSGTVTTAPLGSPPSTYRVTIFNADGEQIQVVEAPIGNGAAAVTRGTIHGSTIEYVIPTCLTGGQPPTGCPFDQTTLLGNTNEFPALTTGSGTSPRSYFRAPAQCPPTGSWQTTDTFSYADGATETVVTHQPCTAGATPSPARRPPRHHPRRPRPAQPNHHRAHRHRHRTCHDPDHDRDCDQDRAR